MSDAPAAGNKWQTLRSYTEARVAIGRSGASMPTREVLDFSMAHARARDAVHSALDVPSLVAELRSSGFGAAEIRSQASGRTEYLRRPDLGRLLDMSYREMLMVDDLPPGTLTVVIADGLSSLAAQRHAVSLLFELQARATEWSFDRVVIATMARVALGDEIGALRRAEAVLVLIGERPGLSSPDSLGAYMTYAPKLGCTDAERNCVSNIRTGGLSYAEAAFKLHYLLTEARVKGRSGVTVKDLSSFAGNDALLDWPSGLESETGGSC